MCAKCEAKNAKNVCGECMLGDVSVYAMDTIEPSNKQSIHIYIVSALRLCARVLLWQPFVATFCCWPSECASVYWQAIKSNRERGKHTHTPHIHHTQKFGHYKYAFDIRAPSKGITFCLYITHTPRGKHAPACYSLTMLATYLICAIQIADSIIQLGIVDRLGNQYIGYTMHTSSQSQSE